MCQDLCKVGVRTQSYRKHTCIADLEHPKLSKVATPLARSVQLPRHVLGVMAGAFANVSKIKSLISSTDFRPDDEPCIVRPL